MSARVAVVTGAASGIGRVAATRLAAQGWAVAAVDLPGAGLDEIGSQSGIRAFPCDVADSGQVGSAAQAVISSLGQVHRLVHAAGIALAGRIEELPVSEFARAMNVNYLGTVHWVRALLPSMRAARTGELALIASLAGWMPTPEMAAYTATKFAVVGFAETLAMELRDSGIVTRCVCPMAVTTPMLTNITGQGRHERLERVVPFITPERVIDALDASWRRPRSKLMVFPDTSSALAWRARRWAPGLLTSAMTRFG